MPNPFSDPSFIQPAIDRLLKAMRQLPQPVRISRRFPNRTFLSLQRAAGLTAQQMEFLLDIMTEEGTLGIRHESIGSIAYEVAAVTT